MYALVADLDNSRWRPLEIPEESPVCVFPQRTYEPTEEGSPELKQTGCFHFRGKDAVQKGLAAVAPEGQWAHRLSVQTLEA